MKKILSQTERFEQHKTLTASHVRKMAGTSKRPKGKPRYIEISHSPASEEKYKIQVTCVPSCLGKGFIWFFICPVTAKRCRKLHLIDGLYQHRSAIKSYYYAINPLPYINREYYKLCLQIQGKIDAERQMSEPQFKTHYAGKPTKRYLKCLKQIKNAGDFTMSGLINGSYDKM